MVVRSIASRAGVIPAARSVLAAAHALCLLAAVLSAGCVKKSAYRQLSDDYSNLIRETQRTQEELSRFQRLNDSLKAENADLKAQIGKIVKAADSSTANEKRRSYEESQRRLDQATEDIAALREYIQDLSAKFEKYRTGHPLGLNLPAPSGRPAHAIALRPSPAVEQRFHSGSFP